MIQKILEILVYGGIQSGVYAILALGFCLMLGVAGIINLTHTAFYMLGAYIIYTLIHSLGINLYVALPISILAVGVIGVVIQHFFIRPKLKSEYLVMMITIAAAYFIQEILHSLYGPVDRNVESFVEGKIELFGCVDIDLQRILTLAVAVFLSLMLWLFINKTKAGKAILAVSEDKEGAILVGINVNKILSQVMFIGATLAAVAGIFIVPTIGAEIHMWENPLVKCFAIVILGGMGSLGGTILASIILGYAEVIVSFTISSYLGELVAMIIILIVLISLPSGLMGKRVEA